jgi:hypothetical protein
MRQRGYHLRRRKMKTSVRLKPDRCLCCGTLIDAAMLGRDPAEPTMPKPGDVTICVYCGHIMAFGNDYRVRPLTDVEMYAVAGDRNIIMAQRAIAEVKRLKR